MLVTVPESEAEKEPDSLLLALVLMFTVPETALVVAEGVA